jgi:periplasmic divalent cation tolerance protein
MTDKRIVLVTCGSEEEAKRIGRALIEVRLAACANIMARGVRSIYRWKGRVKSSRETLLILKTTRARFRRLQSEIRKLHSYEVPEIISVPVAEGFAAYLRWMAESVSGASKTKRGIES